MVKSTQEWVAHGGSIGSRVSHSLGRHGGPIHFLGAPTPCSIVSALSLSLSLSLSVWVEEENGCKWFEGKLEV